MEIGYRLIPMVDQGQNGELLNRIGGIRKKFAKEMGYLPPVLHIRDNMALKPEAYRILMKGVEKLVEERLSRALVSDQSRWCDRRINR
ncbi:Flagellar biosynthesis protein FlhA [Arsenophonus nasoniae]|uniref:Flagellar biosynthesis protein FlhA n=1 Tax=Arsenophonus nasoniae TaxID=638 RepID=A0A4V1BWP7_9GAMM|nr:Flagellar biosynthesis protein FlhA [Arsenophonus nasoniae]